MEEVVRTALDAGYRAFDTAYFYGNEKALGSALKQSNIERDELFITSKLWNDYQGYDQTIEYFNKSLDNLGLDYLDLFLIHWPCENDQLYIESYKALEHLYEEGKIKAIGVCNFKIHHLEKLMRETKITPQVNQIELHPYFNQQDVQDFCDEHDIKVTAWMILLLQILLIVMIKHLHKLSYVGISHIIVLSFLNHKHLNVLKKILIFLILILS